MKRDTKEENKVRTSPYLNSFIETNYACITLIYLAYFKKKTFNEIWQDIIEALELPAISLQELEPSLFEREFKASFEFSERYLKKSVIPEDLVNLLCEAKVLFLFFLTKIPRELARNWAIYYVLFNEIAERYPLYLVLMLTAKAVATTKGIYFCPKPKLKQAFFRLKERFFRNEPITWEVLEKLMYQTFQEKVQKAFEEKMRKEFRKSG